MLDGNLQCCTQHADWQAYAAGRYVQGKFELVYFSSVHFADVLHNARFPACHITAGVLLIATSRQ